MFDKSCENKSMGIVCMVVGVLILTFAARELGISKCFINIVLIIIGMKLVTFGLRSTIKCRK